MSILTVLVGQCGIQVGNEIWKRIQKNERTYSRDGYARCVGVDTEPKVVEKVLSNNAIYRKSNFVSDEEGRGNNWAFGYLGKPPQREQQQQQQRPAFSTKWRPTKSLIYQRTLEVIEEEIKRSNGFIESVIFINSLAGGTGSGLGSRLLEECKSAFSESVMYFINIVIGPNNFGDTAVSCLNSLLTMSTLIKYSNLIIFISNQQIFDFLSVKKKRNQSVTLEDINTFIADSVGLLLQYGTLPCIGCKLVSSLAPHGDHKIATLINHNVTVDDFQSWDTVLRGSVRTSLMRDAVAVNIVACCDEGDVHDLSVKINKIDSSCKALSFDGSIIPNNPSRAGRKEILVSMTSPSTTLLILIPMANQAAVKIFVGAYVHWYQKFGLSIDFFKDALQVIKSVVITNEQYLSKS
eukprot:TRINITY_DN18511_c0_g1_i1.p1 TRINITY_DN18511_c0_g1~~TRINITY_DN18511_c0_g1_i1.p1  ORF type:complete len:422 (+),score=71.42 TRINITY_DN18511_c0_g1_i1:48-1268(+)